MANQYDPHTRQNLRLWLKLFKVSSAIEVTLQERLRHQCQTTLPRFDVMAALDHHPKGLRMSELSRYLRVSNSNVTGIIERLVQDNLVERIRVNQDRRATRARLTHEGFANFAATAYHHAVWVDELLGSLNENEANQMMLLLHKIEPNNIGN
jgi:DNA-binding MarR family transcriptional regulator